MSRNYHAGSRNLDVAASFILKRSGLSFKTQADLYCRWTVLLRWLMPLGIKKMELITRETVIQYGFYIRDRVLSGDMSASTGQNYLSAVNTVLSLATKGKWRPVKPVADCQIPKRKFVATASKASSTESYLIAINKVSERVGMLMELQRHFGLRFKESCLLDARKALKQAKNTGEIILTYGTKGGRTRTVPADSNGIIILEKASKIHDGKSLVPRDQSYKEFRTECYEALKDIDINFHSNRHHYAHRRYREITGAPCPVENNWVGRNRIPKLAEYLAISVADAKEIDQAARLQISHELGHGRAEVTANYVG
jgi:hypothetical protein